MIIEKIKKVGHFFLDKPLIKYWENSSTLRIRKHLANAKKNKKRMPIKVAFIAQMPEVWDKQQYVYETMKADDRFDVSIILVPEFDYEKFKLKNYGDERKFYHRKYPDAKFLLAVNKDGKTIDLKKHKFDYIFYERPYNRYLPKSIRSTTACRYTKVCYIPYATPDYAETANIDFLEFYRYVYMGFMNSEIRCNRLNKYFSDKKSNDCHRIVDFGYPILEACTKLPEIQNEKKNIMWAPRWAFDSDIGGSHFLEYKDLIIDFAKEHDDLKIISRPHPLTFPNLLKTGLMTEKEIMAYKKKCKDNDVSFDDNKIIEDSFVKTDILISDLSSVLWLYFYMGKPIIYCTCDIKLSDDLKEMTDLMYKADNWNDVKKYLDLLIGGNDPMKEKRKEYIKKQMNKFNDIVNNIIEFVYRDYSETML